MADDEVASSQDDRAPDQEETQRGHGENYIGDLFHGSILLDEVDEVHDGLFHDLQGGL